MNLRAVTCKTYKASGKLHCTNSNVIYLISFKLCKEQYVGTGFKENVQARIRVHNSVRTGKDRCGVAKHFLIRYTDGNKVRNTEVQPIEKVQNRNYDRKGKLLPEEKYWQPQSFTLSHGMNSTQYYITIIQ